MCVGVLPTHVHMHAHMHVHVYNAKNYMFRNCKLLPNMEASMFIMFNMCVCVGLKGGPPPNQ